MTAEASSAWVAQAACAGMDAELFFPDQGQSAAEAKAVCRGCPVRFECREHAMRNGERFGVWGGLSERDRRRMRRLQPAVQRPRRTA